MLTKKEVIKKIKLNIEIIRSFGVKKIGIFGSFINNTQKKNSDVDILVEFIKERKTFDNYMDLKFYLEKLFRRKVDLVMSKAVKPELKPYIQKTVNYV